MTNTNPNDSKLDLTKRVAKDVLADLNAALKKAGLWEDVEYFELSIAMKKRDNSAFPNYEWLSCAPVTNDGRHYVYIGAVSKGRHNLVFVGKTSNGFSTACKIANMCAVELQA